jgi:hypothetical protein
VIVESQPLARPSSAKGAEGPVVQPIRATLSPMLSVHSVTYLSGSDSPFLSPSIGGEVSSEARRSGGRSSAHGEMMLSRGAFQCSFATAGWFPHTVSASPTHLSPSGGRGKAAPHLCTKTAHACGKPPPIRRTSSRAACETGGMEKQARHRWSLPLRLLSEGWWLADLPRANPATVIPFARKNPPTIRPEAMGKAGA